MNKTARPDLSEPMTTHDTTPETEKMDDPTGGESAGRATGVKHFVLDTNVLLHNPNALFVFEDNNITIPYPVIEELDKMKRRDDDIGRNARAAIRHLDRLRRAGVLTEGVSWGGIEGIANRGFATGPDGATGLVRVDAEDHERPPVISEESPDNKIIAVAHDLKRRGERAVFVSKDLSARIKSDALGIKTEDFENQKVDADHLYLGYTDAVAPREVIDTLYADRMLPITEFTAHALRADALPAMEPRPNEFIRLTDAEDPSHTGLARRLADTDQLIPIASQKKPTFGIIARNVQQTMALDLLLDDEIKLITLLGAAGHGQDAPRDRRGHDQGLRRRALRQDARCPAHHAHGA